MQHFDYRLLMTQGDEHEDFTSASATHTDLRSGCAIDGRRTARGMGSKHERRCLVQRQCDVVRQRHELVGFDDPQEDHEEAIAVT